MPCAPCDETSASVDAVDVSVAGVTPVDRPTPVPEAGVLVLCTLLLLLFLCSPPDVTSAFFCCSRSARLLCRLDDLKPPSLVVNNRPLVWPTPCSMICCCCCSPLICGCDPLLAWCSCCCQLPLTCCSCCCRCLCPLLTLKFAVKFSPPFSSCFPRCVAVNSLSTLAGTVELSCAIVPPRQLLSISDISCWSLVSTTVPSALAAAWVTAPWTVGALAEPSAGRVCWLYGCWGEVR